jgi:hypothetical protein
VLLLASLEELRSGNSSLNGGGRVDSVDDQSDLSLNLGVLDVSVLKRQRKDVRFSVWRRSGKLGRKRSTHVDIGDDLGTSGLVTVDEEPSRRLGHDPHANTEEDGEQDLKRERESPAESIKKTKRTVSGTSIRGPYKREEAGTNEAPPIKTKDIPKSIQYEMKVPPATIEASTQTRNPRLWDLEVSATQDGMVEVLAPFPRPQMV